MPIVKNKLNEAKKKYEKHLDEDEITKRNEDKIDSLSKETIEEREYNFEYFNYKIESIICNIIFLFSIFFILYGIYNCISLDAHFSSLEIIFAMAVTVSIFGYIAFLAFIINIRKKKKFKSYITDEIEPENILKNMNKNYP